MKKRLLCALLTVTLVSGLALSGCGTKEAPPSLPSNETPETPAVEETVATPAPVVEEEPATEDTGVVEGRGDYISDCPLLTITEYPCETKDSDGNKLFETCYTTISAFCESGDTDAVNENLEMISNGHEHWVAEWTEDFDKAVADGTDGFGDVTPNPDYCLASASVFDAPARVDENVISLLSVYYIDTPGAAHPTTAYEGINIDSHTGRDITLEDMFDDMGEFQAFAYAEAMEQAAEMESFHDIQFYEDASDKIDRICDQPWYFDAAGLEFIYEADVIAPYACSELVFTMTYDKLLSLINPAYLPNLEDGYYAIPDKKECQSTVIDGMMVGYDNGIEDENTCTVFAGRTKYTLTDNGWMMEAYLYKRAQKLYILANYREEDRFNCAVLDVTDGDIKVIYSATDKGFKDTAISQDYFEFYDPYDDSVQETVNVEEVIPFD